MSFYDGSSIDNPKPQKPITPGSQKISLRVQKGENNLSATEFNRKLNFAMEVMKFFPDWENQVYAGEKNKEKIQQAQNQYGEQYTDAEGETQMSFGQVLRSTSYGQLNGANLGGYTDDVDFYDTAGDFDHLNDGLDNDANTPVEALIDDELWSKVQSSLDGESRNYYELIMDGIEKKTPEEAYYLMVSMLESRTRIASTLNEVFGSADLSDEERKANFQSFLQQYSGQIGEKKLGMLEFLMNTQQSFFSRIFPLFGETSEFYQSEVDKEKAEKFYTDLSAKLAEYTGIADLESLTDEQIAQLPEDKKQAVLLLDKWLNPDDIIAPAQNINPKETAWGEYAYEQTSDFVDQLTQENVISRIMARRSNLQYKQKMEEWEEKKEDQSRDEIMDARLQAKNKELSKSVEAKTRRSKLDQAIVQRKSGKVNLNTNANTGSKTSKSNFGQAVARVASRIKAAQGKTTTAIRSAITPAKTANFAKTTNNVVAANISSANKTVASARKASDAVKAVKPAARKTNVLRSASSSKPTRLASTTPQARTAMSKAYTQANIKAKAPKQSKE